MQSKTVIKRLSELPTMPCTIDTMAWNQTGDWRYLTPVVENKPAPCSSNCPAGVPIPDYLSAVNRGDLQQGLALLLSHNPLPGLTGRLCYHPCQTKCRRKMIDGTISIQEIERFMASLHTEIKNRRNRQSDEKVTVIGSGPLGLSCAFYLGCLGFRVTVLDARSRAGGALADLPSKKVEAQVLEDEIRRVVHVADIHLETSASLDLSKPREMLSKADLVILDPTGLMEETGMPVGAVSLDPFGDEEICGDIIAVTLSGNLKPFKAPMIAHYIAAGRLTAEKVFAYLVRRSDKEGLKQHRPDLSRLAAKVDDILMGHFSTSGLTADAKSGQEGVWDHDRALQETGRCLSCGTCNLCLQCVLSCPDASIRLDSDKNAVEVDLYHCKGCGICAYECPRGVITMEEINA